MTSRFSGQGFYLHQDNDRKIEDDFFVCKHCQQGMLKSSWKIKGGLCTQCDGMICFNCHTRTAKFGCEPFVQQFERTINDTYRREQNAKILGI